MFKFITKATLAAAYSIGTLAVLLPAFTLILNTNLLDPALVIIDGTAALLLIATAWGITWAGFHEVTA